ncbi:glycosyltransferase [Flavobacterium sp. RSP49]|uniref:glycosyltransferase n=1 Tax=Flavobacterium sp. RSP49 TaxID=2497487 RepID=UPI000F8379AF|nr:glycosyltransferase [Flavobacterium sp. RSP49]RTZ00897.1 glycosyltransferase [Flavobacterium sp. RSP49]
MEGTHNSLDAKQPLVSVVIVTYNSAPYVLETLESIKNQSYQNIELIISDDASKDNSVALCESWLEANKNRFAATRLLSVSKNTGVVKNFNRGMAAAVGEWLKLLAGDDCLPVEALSKMVAFTQINPNCEVLHAPVLKFKVDATNTTVFENDFSDHPKVLNGEVPALKQFEILTRGCVVNAPAVFIKKTIIERFGAFDTEIPNCEDWPYWLKITKMGIPFHYISEPLAFYRVREDSVYSSGSLEFYITPFYKTEYNIFKKYIMPYVSFYQKYITEYDFYLKKHFSKSKPTIITKILFNSLRMPVTVYYKFT